MVPYSEHYRSRRPPLGEETHRPIEGRLLGDLDVAERMLQRSTSVAAGLAIALCHAVR